jgi:hypothetical protein
MKDGMNDDPPFFGDVKDIYICKKCGVVIKDFGYEYARICKKCNKKKEYMWVMTEEIANKFVDDIMRGIEIKLENFKDSTKKWIWREVAMLNWKMVGDEEE